MSDVAAPRELVEAAASRGVSRPADRGVEGRSKPCRGGEWPASETSLAAHGAEPHGRVRNRAEAGLAFLDFNELA